MTPRTKSRLDSERRWAAKNRDAYLQYRKQYRIDNREELNKRQRELYQERRNIAIDENFIDPKDDPESLFCSPKLDDILNRKIGIPKQI